MHSIFCCTLNLVNNIAVIVCGSPLQILQNLQEVLEKHQENRRAVEETPAARGALPVSRASLGLIETWTENPSTSEGAFFLENSSRGHQTTRNPIYVNESWSAKGTVKGNGNWKGMDWEAITWVGIRKRALGEGKLDMSLLECVLAVTTPAWKCWGEREQGRDHLWCCNLPQRCSTSKPTWALQFVMNHQRLTTSPFSFKIWKQEILCQ